MQLLRDNLTLWTSDAGDAEPPAAAPPGDADCGAGTASTRVAGDAASPTRVGGVDTWWCSFLDARRTHATQAAGTDV